MDVEIRRRLQSVTRRVSLVTLSAVLAGCGGSPTEPSITFRQLRPQGLLVQPFACESRVRVVRGPDEWNMLIAGVRFEESPSIGFGTEMPVLVSLGSRPNSGYEIDIQDVRRKGQRLTIRASEITPGACVTLPVVTCPWTAIVVPRSETVDLEWAAARPGCS